jgi:hypothetical protein
VYIVAALFFSVAACSDESPRTRVVVEIDRTITSSIDPLVFLATTLALPSNLIESTPDDMNTPHHYTFVSLSDEAGPMFDVVIHGYEFDASSASETELFWRFASQDESAEVARVGLRTGFVTGETRFVTLRPTYGCLESTESIPELKPRSLGREGRPLVLDGCSDEDDSTDTGDDSTDTDAGI